MASTPSSPSSASQPRFVALRYRDFRLVWGGELISTIGSQMQLFAVDWHIFQLLRGQTIEIAGQTLGLDAIGLGLSGLARFIPIALFALLGGMLADAFDRRKLIIGARLAAAVLAMLLAIVTLTNTVTIGLIYLLTAALAGVAALDTPARQSLAPNLVAREHLTNAVSLNTLMWQIATIAGPALTGIIIGVGSGLNPSAGAEMSRAELNAHIGLVYALNAVSFIVALAALSMIRYRGQATIGADGIGLKPLMEGLRFTLSTRIILATMLLDFAATFFSSARTMLPIISTEVLGLGPTGYGLLATAQSVGAVLAGIIMAWRGEVHRQGLTLLVSVAIYGAATLVFGLSTSFGLSYLFFALTGAADTVSTVIRGTIRQTMTPDALRGRMVSVNMIFFMGGPQLGELEAGLVAAAFGAPFSIVSGGLATLVITALIAWKYPRLREYTSDTAKEALAAAEASRA